MFKYSLIIITLLSTLNANAQRVELDSEFLNSTKGDFKEAVLKQKRSLSSWTESLEQESPSLICLGETHNAEFRKFYAENFFNSYTIDTLFLEAKPDQVIDLLKSVKAGEPDVELLGADISAVLTAALNKNPKIKIYGVEPTVEQKKEITFDQTKRLNREGFIAQNIMDKFITGEKHVMLYGANHCAINDLGLGGAIPAYRLLKNVLTEGSVRSVKTIFHTNSDYFSANMSLIGIEPETMVIKNANGIDPKAYKYVWKMKAILGNYQDVIYVK
jgi:hypothetical protein